MNRREAFLWSIVFPGFAQLLNGKHIKGILFIFFAVLVNVKTNFNEAILLSFHGDIKSAIVQVDYQWLMFYPCLYFYAMWDSFKDTLKEEENYLFVPFVFGAYFVTVGLIYSSSLKLFGLLFGPVWLPFLFMFPGVGVGLLLKNLVIRLRARN
ncbi:hypothetical protein P9F21_00465 [Metabacillus fastidiosus]|nr:hypothetical protein [Metabacillus fastidiosus]MEC2074522.1 hypothetical protein [Metabacillus fastidiosus]